MHSEAPTRGNYSNWQIKSYYMLLKHKLSIGVSHYLAVQPNGAYVLSTNAQ